MTETQDPKLMIYQMAEFYNNGKYKSALEMLDKAKASGSKDKNLELYRMRITREMEEAKARGMQI